MLARLVDGLPDRFADLASCGLPDTLVHGDFHPGNTRGVPGRTETLVLLDWGDSGVGNPLLDLPPFLGVLAPEQEGRSGRTGWRPGRRPRPVPTRSVPPG